MSFLLGWQRCGQYHSMMLTVWMNEAAETALQPLTGGHPSSATLHLGPDLQDKLAKGLTCNEGAWIFTDHVGQWVAAPASSLDAIAKMGWENLTGYEWNVNAFHLEDYAAVHVANLDGQPQIAYEDQLLLVRLGLAVADGVFDLLRGLAEPVPVRCVISANVTCVVFRFHQIRSGDDWIESLNDVLRKPDATTMMVVADRYP
ncbi:hypothetical protein OIE66_40075 [Nonomuraea sp. NBC_01738]|uniref:hypothetical protein n=1 Tax=Nonomuraea sp. NBC_01738 TaxID=2976003 RepID=UPI002E1596E7|nr:hypothetical protein OIE66_40075 [Nonomuraea sp. NBC_01738]